MSQSSRHRESKLSKDDIDSEGISTGSEEEEDEDEILIKPKDLIVSDSRSSSSMAHLTPLLVQIGKQLAEVAAVARQGPHDRLPGR